MIWGRPSNVKAAFHTRAALVAALALVVVIASVVVASGQPARRGVGGHRPQAVTAQFPRPGAVVPPTNRVYFGTHFPRAAQNRMPALMAAENTVGRRFDIDHVYYGWDTPFPAAYDKWTASQGRILFFSWTSRMATGRPVRWDEIAAGRQDAVIDARAAAIAAFGRPVFVSFTHEPGALVGDGGSKAGTEADYVSAWRHIVTRFRQQRTTNVSWVWVLSTYGFRDSGTPDALYPGDDYIDWIGADGYNLFNCPWLPNPWRSWQQIFDGFYQWALPHHKPLMAAEFGSLEDPRSPQRKGDWFLEAAQQIRAMPAFRAIVYFNSEVNCPGYAVSSPGAAAGYKAMASDAYFNSKHGPGRSRVINLLVAPAAAHVRAPEAPHA